MPMRLPLLAALSLLAAASGCTIVDADDLFAPAPVYNCAVKLSAYPPAPAQAIAVRVDLTIPDDERLDTLTVEVQPQMGHERLPAGMPRVALIQVLGDSALATVATVQDESPDVAAYEEPHDLTIQAPALAGPPYAALSFGESGKGAVPYGRMLNWRCTTRPPPPPSP